ncbi:superoxide dismutase, partial [Pseudoalteromonas sp. AOP7-A1-14]
MAFTLPALSYEYDALEPHIDTKTMQIHHTLHHQTYVNKANAALKNTEYENTDVHELLANIASLPEALQKAVQEHGGGHANHSLFWTIMGPEGGCQPKGVLLSAIT